VSSAAIAICLRGSDPNERCRPITPTGVLAARAHAVNAQGAVVAPSAASTLAPARSAVRLLTR
jgi:hypothetical protein